jgi:hypothetical protein
VVYCSAFANGDANLKAFITSQYENHELSAKQRSLLLNARACETDPEILDT